MKKRILSIVALAALVALPMSVFAQGPTNIAQQAEGKAQIVSVLAIANDNGSGVAQKLDFGIISSNATEGTVIVTPEQTAVRTNTGGATLVSSTSTSAAFTVSGNPGSAFTLTLPAAALTIKGTDVATREMTIDTWTSSLDGSSKIGTLDASGEHTFYVGGTLRVAANQPADIYKANFTVNVHYN